MAALTKSPAGPGARRSSSGSDKLRPVLPFGLDDVDYSGVDDEEGDVGPVPKGTGSFPSGGGVDEVEYAYGLVHTFFFSGRSLVLTYRLACECEFRLDVQTKPHSLVSWRIGVRRLWIM
jgi:hypothetical protein